MKTYKILILVLISFLVGVVIFEKIVLKKEVAKIDTTDRFGAYYIKNKLPPFSHIVIHGNNVGITKLMQGMGPRSIRYGNYMTDKIKHKVQKDTLYISYDATLQKNNFAALWGNGTNSTKNVVVHYDTISSIKTTKSRSYVLAEKLPELNVDIEKNSWFCLHGLEVGQLDIVSQNSQVTFFHGPSTYTDQLHINASNHSKVALENIFAKSDDFQISEDSKLDRHGYNEAHVPK